MSTIFFSKENFIVHVNEILSPIDDGYFYKVVETNLITPSSGRAFRNARNHIKKLRDPNFTPTVKRQRTKPVKKTRTRKNSKK